MRVDNECGKLIKLLHLINLVS